MLVHLGIGGHVDCLTKLFGSQKRCCNGQWLLTSHYFEHCIYKEFNGCIYHKNLHLPQKLYLTWLTLIPHELLFQHTLQCSSRSKVKLSILKSKSDSSLLSVEKLCQTKLFFFWLQIGCFVTGANLLGVEEDDQTFFGIFNFFLLCFLSISSSLSFCFLFLWSLLFFPWFWQFVPSQIRSDIIILTAFILLVLSSFIPRQQGTINTSTKFGNIKPNSTRGSLQKLCNIALSSSAGLKYCHQGL